MCVPYSIWPSHHYFANFSPWGHQWTHLLSFFPLKFIIWSIENITLHRDIIFWCLLLLPAYVLFFFFLSTSVFFFSFRYRHFIHHLSALQYPEIWCLLSQNLKKSQILWIIVLQCFYVKFKFPWIFCAFPAGFCLFRNVSVELPMAVGTAIPLSCCL